MKKGLFGLMMSCLLCLHSAQAATGYGLCNYGKETVSSVQCYGPTQLADTHIQGSVSVAGPLIANNTTMQSMNVKGMATLTGSTVQANVQVSGYLTANHGNFTGDVKLDSNEAAFVASTIKGSVIMQSNQTPVLILRCGTTVSGNVTFKDSPGIIKKSKDSKVTGKVVNGTVEVLENDKCPE